MYLGPPLLYLMFDLGLKLILELCDADVLLRQGMRPFTTIKLQFLVPLLERVRLSLQLPDPFLAPSLNSRRKYMVKL